MSLVCFEVFFLCHPCSNHTKSGIVVAPGAVAWENLTGKVLSGLRETPSSAVLLHQAEHMSSSMVLLLSDSIEHKIMWAGEGMLLMIESTFTPMCHCFIYNLT